MVLRLKTAHIKSKSTRMLTSNQGALWKMLKWSIQDKTFVS